MIVIERCQRLFGSYFLKLLLKIFLKNIKNMIKWYFLKTVIII